MAQSRTAATEVAIEPSTQDSEKLLSNVLVAIPAYNEEIAIGSVVVRARTLTGQVLVVDDGSDDDTEKIARQAGATVIAHDENRGKGAAVRSIFEYADEQDVDAVVMLDGDGQHLPRDIPDVARPVLAGDCDLVIGSRYAEGTRTETPIHRRIGQRILDAITPGSRGSSLTDTQSGFRAFSQTAVAELTIRTDGIGVESEMVSAASEKGLRVEEVPIDVRYEDVDGQTYNPVRHGLSVAMFALQLVRDRHPLVFFGIPGVVALSVGGALGAQAVWAYQTDGVFYQWRVVTSAFSVLLGTLAVFCGLVLNQVATMLEEVQ